MFNRPVRTDGLTTCFNLLTMQCLCIDGSKRNGTTTFECVRNCVQNFYNANIKAFAIYKLKMKLKVRTVHFAGKIMNHAR